MKGQSKGTKRTFTWPILIVLGIAMVPVAIMGLWGFMALTAITLHPNPDGVSSVIGSEPSTSIAGAVDRARRLVRAHLSERNLPGISAAVGIDGELVWAEGFGWADYENRVQVRPDTRFRIGTTSMVTTQFYFLDRINSHIYKNHPLYLHRPTPSTTNRTDGVLGGSASRMMPYIFSTKFVGSKPLRAWKTIVINTNPTTCNA